MTRSATTTALALLLGGGLLLAGCHPRPRGGALAACDSVAAQDPSTFDLSRLNGSFDATFVATTGTKAGQRVRGRLQVHPQDAGLVSVRHADSTVVVSQPSIGTLDLAVDSVGAVRVGDPMLESVETPGVGLYVTRLANGGVSGVIARVGSGSNTRGQALFDGGYFTMFVTRVSDAGFWGTWQSATGAGMNAQEARGHFCAVAATTAP